MNYNVERKNNDKQLYTSSAYSCPFKIKLVVFPLWHTVYLLSHDFVASLHALQQNIFLWIGTWLGPLPDHIFTRVSNHSYNAIPLN